MKDVQRVQIVLTDVDGVSHTATYTSKAGPLEVEWKHDPDVDGEQDEITSFWSDRPIRLQPRKQRNTLDFTGYMDWTVEVGPS